MELRWKQCICEVEGGSEMRLDGMFATVSDAKHAVERLNQRGYIQEDLTVAMNHEVRAQLDLDFEADLAAPSQGADERVSFGESFRNMMSFDEVYAREDGSEFKLPSRYHKDIAKGRVGVFINTDAENPTKRRLDSLRE